MPTWIISPSLLSKKAKSPGSLSSIKLRVFLVVLVGMRRVLKEFHAFYTPFV